MCRRHADAVRLGFEPLIFEPLPRRPGAFRSRATSPGAAGQGLPFLQDPADPALAGVRQTEETKCGLVKGTGTAGNSGSAGGNGAFQENERSTSRRRCRGMKPDLASGSLTACLPAS